MVGNLSSVVIQACLLLALVFSPSISLESYIYLINAVMLVKLGYL